MTPNASALLMGRSPHGERGLKSSTLRQGAARLTRRSPHGERGLKFARDFGANFSARSLPARGAWIEIAKLQKCLIRCQVAPRTGSVD